MQQACNKTQRTAIYLHLIVVVSPMATQAYSQQLEHHLPLPEQLAGEPFNLYILDPSGARRLDTIT